MVCFLYMSCGYLGDFPVDDVKLDGTVLEILQRLLDVGKERCRDDLGGIVFRFSHDGHVGQHEYPQKTLSI